MPREIFKTKVQYQKWVRAHAVLLRRPAVILLEGGLGAGKTQSVRWFCEALGVNEAASPTFAIHNEYSSADGTIDHVDLYRVKSDADLENSGFWDLLTKDQAMVFVEWASRLPRDVWPKGWTQLFLRLEKTENGEEERSLDWEIRKP